MSAIRRTTHEKRQDEAADHQHHDHHDQHGRQSQRGQQEQQQQQNQQSRRAQSGGQRESAVLQHGRSTFASDISQAVTTKRNQLFMLTTATGDIVPGNAGLGLYFRDTRFLDHLEMRLNDQPLTSLMADAAQGASAVFELTNPDLLLDNGETLSKERLSVQRTQTLDDHLTDVISLRNRAQEELALDLTLVLGSEFTNMFVVRGAEPGKRGTLHKPQDKHGALILEYDGADHHRRTTTAQFDPAPNDLHSGLATWHVRLTSHESWTLTTTLLVADTPMDEDHPRRHSAADEKAATSSTAQQSHQQRGNHSKHDEQDDQGNHQRFVAALGELPTIETNNPLFDRALTRGFADLRMLGMADSGDVFVAAGVPWYVALFGRDSLIASYETLAFHPALARMTLELLARYQGTKDDDFQDEQPGKILHELRVGEKANLHEVPQIPYYGTVDATPWFLLLLGEYVRWTGDIGLFVTLHDNVLRALEWIDDNLSGPIEGFLSYGSRSEKGLLNQGWKDSGNGIVNADGSLARPPIALVEVQGYLYGAWHAVAALFRQTGDAVDALRAEQLDQQADDLRKRFHEAYWMADKNFFALALQRDLQPARAIASNPGQALFSGIVDAGRAKAVAKRLLADDMFSGWGVRTLSANEQAYNPLDYQVGSIWPHDNALIALGLRRYGFAEQVEQIFTGIFDAATRFQHYRLPEVFDGFSRDRFDRPVHYPVACNPQAWAAGALPLLLTASLGLEPDAVNGQLCIFRPRLPEWLSDVTLRGLRIGRARVDLRYRREGDTTLVAVLKRHGDLDITVDY
ncbi:MAG: glycogen debranching N-terminal domain-containing protein [Ktedonobacterales bacterium]